MQNTRTYKALALATAIAELRRMTADKEAEFERLMGGRPGPASRVSGPSAAPRRTNGSGLSIAQQVLGALSDGPATRGELIQRLGGHEAAVTSALKKHKERGSIDNQAVPGKWSLVKRELVGPAMATQSAVTPVQVRKARTAK